MPNNTTITAEPGKQELFIIREFDAPRELVWRALTDPELYVKWVGPKDLKMSIQKFDMSDGGSYRYTHERGDEKYEFFGTTHEATAPERIVGTFEFGGMPDRGHVIMGKTSFEDLPGGRTRLVHHSVFFSVEDRDGMIRSGMEHGVNDGYQKLDQLLESERAANAV